MSFCLILAALHGCSRREPVATTGRPVALPGDRTIRAVWVARMHYRYADDVRVIIRNCAELGANTVLWQVRGSGTVAYPSQLEPWAAEFDYRDPGFDPLATAIEEAHQHGLRLEVWVNVMPGWTGKNPPPIRDQLYYQRPEWFLYDARGQRQPLGDFYVILNPCLPEVRAHISGIIDEIARTYPVDGVHLDYVRYAWDTTPRARELYPRDPRTLALYERETGRRPDDDGRAWDAWRANQLTRLVAEIRETLERRRPGAALTAAVVPDPARAARDYFQNGAAWLRAGLLDAVMPMAYTDDVRALSQNVLAYRAAAPNRRVVPGLGIYKHAERQQIIDQMQRCREWGGDFALFSYDSIHATADDRKAGGPDRRKSDLRLMRRSTIREFLEG